MSTRLSLKDWCATCCHGSTIIVSRRTWKRIPILVKKCYAPKGGMRARIGSKGFRQVVVKCGMWEPPAYMRYYENLYNEKDELMVFLRKQVELGFMPKERLGERLEERRLERERRKEVHEKDL